MWRSDFGFWCTALGLLYAVGSLFLLPSWWRGSWRASRVRWRDRVWLVTHLALAALFLAVLVATILESDDPGALYDVPLWIVSVLLFCLIPPVGWWGRFDFAVPPRLRTAPTAPERWASAETLTHGNRRERRRKGRAGKTTESYLRIHRPSRVWRDRFRTYQLEVDGQVAGVVRNGTELILPVRPGRHTVRAVIDWTGSAPLTVSVEGGDTVSIRVQPSNEPAREATGTPDSYLQLTLEAAG
ncbi:hypothetical protein [Actinoplanes solisilvae]|uniref:hypothetical protein n=1 Tax=Actinoplanes solisilvae TaxID=2486853 RepID=UPI000FDB0F34|nr:hypothetical protein [Actinoplanes solisilvae]